MLLHDASGTSDRDGMSTCGLQRIWLTPKVPKLRTMATEAVRFYCGDRVNSKDKRENELVEYVKYMLEMKDMGIS